MVGNVRGCGLGLLSRVTGGQCMTCVSFKLGMYYCSRHDIKGLDNAIVARICYHMRFVIPGSTDGGDRGAHRV